MTTFWSLWIIVITVGTLLGCAILLVWCLKDKMGVEEGVDMGHEYDGIRELNNPLPK
ncbi:cbb3-type cytochrome c oxidase N-terminal domain-containing protein, partial [Vibrio parahaemolyticus]|nr:cbb3-type cytochrome c oxidase N-terminal domain-containing protein [Vibrio parahaemolyticus]